jgi:hypothetical protein
LSRHGWGFEVTDDVAPLLIVTIGDDPPRMSQARTLEYLGRLEAEVIALLDDGDRSTESVH